MGLEEAIAYASLQGITGTTADHHEGVAAFRATPRPNSPRCYPPDYAHRKLRTAARTAPVPASGRISSPTRGPEPAHLSFDLRLRPEIPPAGIRPRGKTPTHGQTTGLAHDHHAVPGRDNATPPWTPDWEQDAPRPTSRRRVDGTDGGLADTGDVPAWNRHPVRPQRSSAAPPHRHAPSLLVASHPLDEAIADLVVTWVEEAPPASGARTSGRCGLTAARTPAISGLVL